jgi:hypothetical protein
MSRREADRPVRWVAQRLAPVVGLAVIATILALSLGLFAVRSAGLSTYVVQGGPTESMVPIGSLVLVAPMSADVNVPFDPWEADAPRIGTAWVAVPTLGYAVTYADAYSSPIVMGLVVWILSVVAVRALAPHISTSRRRLPA